MCWIVVVELHGTPVDLSDCAADGGLVTLLPGPVRLALPGRGKVHAAPHHLHSFLWLQLHLQVLRQGELFGFVPELHGTHTHTHKMIITNHKHNHINHLQSPSTRNSK